MACYRRRRRIARRPSIPACSQVLQAQVHVDDDRFVLVRLQGQRGSRLAHGTSSILLHHLLVQKRLPLPFHLPLKPASPPAAIVRPLGHWPHDHWSKTPVGASLAVALSPIAATCGATQPPVRQICTGCSARPWSGHSLIVMSRTSRRGFTASAHDGPHGFHPRRRAKSAYPSSGPWRKEAHVPRTSSSHPLPLPYGDVRHEPMLYPCTALCRLMRGRPTLATAVGPRRPMRAMPLVRPVRCRSSSSSNSSSSSGFFQSLQSFQFFLCLPYLQCHHRVLIHEPTAASQTALDWNWNRDWCTPLSSGPRSKARAFRPPPWLQPARGGRRGRVRKLRLPATCSLRPATCICTRDPSVPSAAHDAPSTLPQ